MPKPRAGIFAPVFSVYWVARVATVRTLVSCLQRAARAENKGFPKIEMREEIAEVEAMAGGVDDFKPVVFIEGSANMGQEATIAPSLLRRLLLKSRKTNTID